METSSIKNIIILFVFIICVIFIIYLIYKYKQNYNTYYKNLPLSEDSNNSMNEQENNNINNHKTTKGMDFINLIRLKWKSDSEIPVDNKCVITPYKPNNNGVSIGCSASQILFTDEGACSMERNNSNDLCYSSDMSNGVVTI